MKTQTKSFLNNCFIFSTASLCQRSGRAIGGLAVLLAGLSWSGSVQAADIVWTNTAGGNWSAAANWSPNQAPSTNDTAWITNNGIYTVTLDANVTLSGLALGGDSGTQTLSHATYTLSLNGPGSSSSHGVYTLTGGIVTGSGALTLNGPFNWSGGTLGSAGSATVVTAKGGLTISGGGKYLYATLVNNGAGTCSAGPIWCYSTALLSNTPAGTLDLTTDGSPFQIGSGNPLFANAGALRKTAGTGSTTFYLLCANTGSVQVNSGTLILTLTDGTGSFSVAGGATLSVNGTATLGSGASITGAGNFTMTTGLLTNNGTFNVSGTNTFTGGTAVFAGGCTLTNNTLVVNGGTVAFNGPGTVAPASLLLSQGTLQGSQAVTVSGPFVWSGGYLGSAGSTTVVTANGGLTMNGFAKYLYGTLVNNGAGTWSAWAVYCYGTAQFSNAPAATLDLTADGNFLYVAGGSPTFVNAGTLRKTAGSGTTAISLPCANIGSVQANSGTLALTLTNGTGSFTVASGSTFSVNGTATLSAGSSITGAGNYTMTAGAITNYGTLNVSGTNTFSGGTAVFAGGGTLANNALVVNGGTVMLNGSGAVAPAFLSVSDGTLQGSQAVTVSGPFVWSGGMLGSAGSATVITANGGLTMNGLAKNLYATLVNNSAGVWSAGQIGCYGAALFSNTPAATLDFTADGNAIYSGGSVYGLLVNAGLLRKTAGAGTTTLSLPCANTASVQANSGTLALTLTNGTGGFSVASGATFSVNGTATLAAGSSITGAGNFAVTGGLITNNGTLNVGGTNTFSAGTAVFVGGCTITNTLAVNGGMVMLNGSGTVAPAFLSVSGGTLQGSQAVTVSGPFVWSGGALGGAGSATVVTANGGLTMNGTGKYLNTTLVNNSAGAWSAGQINCYGSALFSNTPAATLDLAADGTVMSLTGGNGLLANAGALRKTAGAGTTILTLPCANAGSVQINSGVLFFSDSFVQTGGQTLLNGGNLTFNTTAQLRGGTLSGSGTITGSVSNNAAIGTGASPGLLAISGNYTEGANAHLAIKLGGTSAGTNYDQLSIGGSAALAGTLDVSYWNGFTPPAGSFYTVLACNARTGFFSAITAPTNTTATVYTAKTVLVEPGNSPPAAKLTVPAQSLAGHNFTVNGSGTDLDGTVSNLTLLVGTNILVSAPGSSAQVNFSSDFPGNLTFTAVATDNGGAQGATNATVAITTLPLRMLDAVGFQTNLAFKLCMLGEAGTNYQVWASTNLAVPGWTMLGTMESTNGIWRFFDTTATNSPRFYRAKQLP
jgi:hypothetical protein